MEEESMTTFIIGGIIGFCVTCVVLCVSACIIAGRCDE
jgi:hypothetical protein